MQAPIHGLATQAEGTSVITETNFRNPFVPASEMIRMGLPHFPSTAAAPWCAARKTPPELPYKPSRCGPAIFSPRPPLVARRRNPHRPAYTTIEPRYEGICRKAPRPPAAGIERLHFPPTFPEPARQKISELCYNSPQVAFGWLWRAWKPLRPITTSRRDHLCGNQPNYLNKIGRPRCPKRLCSKLPLPGLAGRQAEPGSPCSLYAAQY